MEDDRSTEKQSSPNKLNFRLDLKAIIFLLLLVIIGMFILWKPWDAASSQQEDRVITVRGESKITAEPDEYIFTPVYEFKNASKEAALASLTKKSEEVIAGLKTLSVPDNKIKSDSDGYNYNYHYDQASGQNIYNLRLTVTVENKDIAEKVQNYLINTTPTGSVSPHAGFSDHKRTELESKARDEATKDARSKAEQSAKNLGFKIGKVKSINDNSDQAGIMPLHRGGASTMSIAEDAAGSKLSVQPGEDDLTYFVEVIYYLR